jgi:DNA-binding CsgD family transcriptional regulator
MITYPSPVEMLIIKLAIEGYSDLQISIALNIQDKTVKNRLEIIYTKLKVRTRKEAMLWYKRDFMIRAYGRVDPSTYVHDSKETRVIDEATPLDEYMDTPLHLKHTKKRPDVSIPPIRFFRYQPDS